jgi:hypothetical protein
LALASLERWQQRRFFGRQQRKLGQLGWIERQLGFFRRFVGRLER